MKKSWLIIFLVILFNFVLLSIGYSQSNVNVRAYVPETEANRDIKINEVKQVNPTTKENKYLYFFEKNFFEESEEESAQTIHDKIASNVLMWLIIVIAVIIILVFIKMVDHYIIDYF